MDERQNRKLLFLCPLGPRPECGLFLKAQAQLEALQEFFSVEAVLLERSSSSKWEIFKDLLQFQIRGIKAAARHECIYYRISPLLPLLNLYLVVAKRGSFIGEVNGNPWAYRHTRRVMHVVLSRIFFPPLFAAAKELFAVTSELGAQIQSQVASARVRIVPNGYPPPPETPPPFSSLPAALQEQLRLLRQRFRFFIVSTSSFSKRHGLERQVMLVNSLPESCLVLVGDGEVAPEVSTLVHKLKLQNRVLLTGKLPTSCLEEIYQMADFGIESKVPEKSGLRLFSSLKVREYLCYGLPVVLFNHDEQVAPLPWVHLFQSEPELVNFLMSLTRWQREAIKEDSRRRFSYRDGFGVIVAEIFLQHSASSLAQVDPNDRDLSAPS